MQPLFSQHCISYTKGVNPQDVLEDYVGYDNMISFDLVKYYDHITMQDIIDCLVKFGLTYDTAKLISRYCVVLRYNKNGPLQTLQQGSAASPVLSNIVGNYLIDVPLEKIIDDVFYGREVKFIRFSDNVAIFFNGEITSEMYAELRDKIISTLEEEGFKTHKWARIKNTHPYKNQHFLGVVLNKVKRVEKDKLKRLVSMLFNICRGGYTACKDYAWLKDTYTLPEAIEKINSTISGNIEWVNSTNRKHGTMLKKLLKASEFLNCADKGTNNKYWMYDSEMNAYRPKKIMDAIRAYKAEESITAFITRLKEACGCSKTQ